MSMEANSNIHVRAERYFLLNWLGCETIQRVKSKNEKEEEKKMDEVEEETVEVEEEVEEEEETVEVDDGGELQTQVPGSQTGWPPLIAEPTLCLTS